MADLKSASAQGQHAYGDPINRSTPINMNNSKLPNVSSLIQAGIDPKTGLPLKAAGKGEKTFKENNRKLLRIIDEQDAINRFTWYNLPSGLDSQLIERILYYKGQGMFFYMEANDEFYFLPYALDGTIDVYGRFMSVTPLPFNGTATDGKEKPGKEKPWITGLSRKPVYGIKLEELKIEDLTESCVILKDYSPQSSETIISRQVLNDPLLDIMADCLPFMHTALLNSTGISGMRVNGEDEQSNVIAASQSITYAALTGEKFVPIAGQVDFQELTGGDVAKSEEFLLALQSMDNYRLSLYGLDNGGLFLKKSHMLQEEQNMNAGKASLVMQDCLTRRQNFCDIVNSIWGLGIWVEISEPVLGIDRDGDGESSENNPGSISYESEGGEGDAESLES